MVANFAIMAALSPARNKFRGFLVSPSRLAAGRSGLSPTAASPLRVVPSFKPQPSVQSSSDEEDQEVEEKVEEEEEVEDDEEDEDEAG